MKRIGKKHLFFCGFVIILLIGITYSRFISVGNIDTLVDVAAWSVKINGRVVNSTCSFTLDDIVWSEAAKVADGYVAPGGSGYYEITIDTTGTKVAVDYSIGFDSTVFPDMRLKIDRVTMDDVEVASDNGYYDGFISLDDVLNNKIVKFRIYISWAAAVNDNDDHLDTNLALTYGKIELPIVASVRQHIENTDPTNILMPQIIPYKETMLFVDRPHGLIVNPDYTSFFESLYENPERGLYNSNFLVLSKTGNSVKEMKAKVSKLLYLKVDLSAFSAWRNGADIELTDNAIDTLRAQLSKIKQNDNTVILRFVYDNNLNGIYNDNNTKFEPQQAMLVRHIEQLKNIFQEFSTTIYTLQVGFYGLWGESYYNTDVNSHPEYYHQTMEALLEATEGTEIIIAFRTPSYARSAIEGSSYDTSRVGVFNDAYLSQNDDMGTFTNRNADVLWLNARNTSYGGEALAATFSDTTETVYAYGNDATYSAVGGLANYVNSLKTKTNNWDLASYVEDEMYKTHASYINFEWNQYKHYIWAKQIYNGSNRLYHGRTALEYIQSHLGYRLVLKNIELPRQTSSGASITTKITIENVGFGNVLKSKNATLIFTDSSNNVLGSVDVTSKFDIKKFLSTKTVSKKFSFNLPSLSVGTYNVYLRVSSGEVLSNGTYYSAIRFANNSMWNALLQANYIGKIKIV